MMDLGFNWTKVHATDKTIDYLKSLPSELFFTAGGLVVKLFHATPTKNNLYWTEDRDEKFFREMAQKAHADVMVYGHTHKPYRKDIEGKVFINAGSVGKPKDGDTRACLTVLEIDNAKVVSSFVRVPYDLEKTAGAIIESGMPAYFAERLREGR
jgi:putative phosphoesterase